MEFTNYKIKSLALVIILLFAAGCRGGAGSNNPNQSVKFNKIAYFSKMPHLKNEPGRSAILYLNFSPQGLQQLKGDQITIDINILNRSKRAILPEHHFSFRKDTIVENRIPVNLVATGNNHGIGAVEVQAVVNNVPQVGDGILKTMVSYRTIKGVQLDRVVYHNDFPGTATVTLASDAVDDNFIVSFEGNGITLSEHSYQYQDFYKGDISHNVDFKVDDISLLERVFKATIQDDEMDYSDTEIISCQQQGEGIYFDHSGSDHEISWGRTATLKLMRCTNAMHQPLSGVVNIDSDNILAVEGGSNTFHFDEDDDTAMIVINRKSDQVTEEDYKFKLPSAISVTAKSDSDLADTITISNKSSLTPYLNLDKDLNIARGSMGETTYSSNITDKSKINIQLYDPVDTTATGAKVELINNADKKMIRISNTGGLAVGKKYILKSYLNGKSINMVNNNVLIIEPEKMKFELQPQVKRVLQDFPSFYYLNIADGSEAVATNENKIYLYWFGDKAGGCTSLTVRPVNPNNLSLGEECKLSTQTETADKPCSCDISNGRIGDKKCIFQIKMSDSYKIGNLGCRISIRTKDGQYNLGLSEIQTVAGLPKIIVQAREQGAIKNAGFMTLWGEVGSASQAQFNNDWVTALSQDNINNGDLFKDNKLFELDKSYFEYDENNRRTVIKNYPGRNNDNEAVLPAIRFILRAPSDSNSWDDNKCGGTLKMQPNLGCSNWGGALDNNNRKGAAFIEQNALKVTKSNGINIIGNSKINIPSGWYEGGGLTYKVIGDPKVYSSGGNNITLDINYDYAH